MVKCPKCAAAEDDTASFCAECGEKLMAIEDGVDSSVGRDEEAAPGGGPVATEDRTGSDQREAAGVRPDSGNAPPTSPESEDACCGVDAASGAGVEAPPIELEINDNHFYMEKYACALEFRLLNRSGANIEDVSFSVSSQLLGTTHERRFPVVRLNEYRDGHDRIQIVPELAGEHVVDITLRFRIGGEIHVWTAQPFLKVWARNENPSTINIDASMHAGGNIGYGLSVRDQVSKDVAAGQIRDVNDLIKQVYPAQWNRVSLLRRDAGVRVVEELARVQRQLDKASIVFRDGDGETRTLLLGQPKIRMGRKREQNDVILRLVPRSGKHDHSTRMIGQSHLVIALRRDGLYLADRKTVNGTRVDGQPVTGEVKLPLDRPAEVEVATTLRLRLTPYRDATGEAAVTAERYSRLGPPDSLWQMSESLGLRSLLIERVDNLAGEERYVVVYRWAACGTGIDNEIRGPGPDRRQLRVLRLGERLWVESQMDENNLVADGVPIAPGCVFPLSPGLQFAGGLQGSVEEFAQLGM